MRRSWKRNLGAVTAACLAFILAATGVSAQISGSDLFGGVGPAQKVTVSATPSQAVVSPTGQLTIAVILDHAEHWHTWPSVEQDVLPPEIAEFALRTSVTLTEQPDWVSAIGPTQWPEPSLAPVPNVSATGPPTIDVLSYSGRAIAYVPLLVSADAAEGEKTLTIDVFYQACDESQCLIPKTVSVDVPITVRAFDAGETSSTTDAAHADFEGFDASVFARMLAGEVAAAPAAPTRTFFGVALPSGEGIVGLAILAILSAVGGFILNLTPCVLPVIPIKVMTISHHAGTPGRSLVLGLWMAIGVVGFWFAIGLPVALATSASGWDPSRIFGYWQVTLLIGLLIAVMGLGIMGLFAISLPKSVYMVEPKADNALGSFLFGVMTAVLGMPCFGFVAGALLAGAATQPAHVILTIFTSIGVGMAAPYLVLAARPSLVDRIPRTGPASEVVKQVMGLLLLAAGAYFLGASALAFVSERATLSSSLPWWTKTLHWWFVTLFAVAAGGWLMLRTVQITKKPGRRVVFALISLLISGAALAYAADATARAKNNFWIPFDEASLRAALDDGQVVVLDFTAEWCLNCKALKAAVLMRDPVRSELLSAGVTPMVADLTSIKAAGWDKLSELGQTGIPLLVVYGPGDEAPWKSNAYTSQQVLDALARARQGASQAQAVLPAQPRF